MDRRSLLKLLIVTVVASLVAWFYGSGAYLEIEPEQLRAWVRQAGPWGALLFVVAYATLQPLGVTGIFFLLSAPMIWSAERAFLLNWVGTMGTALTSFAFARFVARDYIQARLPEGMRRFDERLYTRGFRTVLLLRLVFYTSPSFQYALGVSRVRFAPFFAASLLGTLPHTLAFTLLGVQADAWLRANPPRAWPWDTLGPLIVIAVVAFAAFGILFARRWRRLASS